MRGILSRCSRAGSSYHWDRMIWTHPGRGRNSRASSLTRGPSTTLSRLKGNRSSTRFSVMICISYSATFPAESILAKAPPHHDGHRFDGALTQKVDQQNDDRKDRILELFCGSCVNLICFLKSAADHMYITNRQFTNIPISCREPLNSHSQTVSELQILHTFLQPKAWFTCMLLSICAEGWCWPTESGLICPPLL